MSGWKLIFSKLKSRVKEFYVHMLLKNDRYVLAYPLPGMGDILQFLMHLKSLKSQHPGKKFVILVTKRHFKELVKLYSKVVFRVVLLSENQCARIEEKAQEEKAQGEFYTSGYWKKVYDKKNPKLYFHYSIMAGYGIPERTPAYIPQVNYSYYKNKKLMKQGLVKGKTVIIAPEAVSNKDTIPTHTWLKVASLLEKMGFKVYFNSKNQQFGRSRLLFLPLKETLQAIDLGGGFIGYRSGLCDVVSAFTKSQQIIIYPDNKVIGEHPFILGYDQNPNEKYMDYCSLKNIYPESDIIELIYSEEALLFAVREVFGNGQDSH